jgi:hypothetical protein
VFKILKNPFASNEDPVEHMVALLCEEADSAGTPFNEDEKMILRRESKSDGSVPEELRQRAKRLIEKLLRKEQISGAVTTDPKSFDSSLEWAGDPGYPNIVALTEEVVSSIGSLKPPSQLQRLRRAKDLIQLVGCALLVVLLMFVIVGIFAIVSHSK